MFETDEFVFDKNGREYHYVFQLPDGDHVVYRLMEDEDGEHHRSGKIVLGQDDCFGEWDPSERCTLAKELEAELDNMNKELNATRKVLRQLKQEELDLEKTIKSLRETPFWSSYGTKLQAFFNESFIGAVIGTCGVDFTLINPDSIYAKIKICLTGPALFFYSDVDGYSWTCDPFCSDEELAEILKERTMQAWDRVRREKDPQEKIKVVRYAKRNGINLEGAEGVNEIMLRQSAERKLKALEEQAAEIRQTLSDKT